MLSYILFNSCLLKVKKEVSWPELSAWKQFNTHRPFNHTVIRLSWKIGGKLWFWWFRVSWNGVYFYWISILHAAVRLTPSLNGGFQYILYDVLWCLYTYVGLDKLNKLVKLRSLKWYLILVGLFRRDHILLRVDFLWKDMHSLYFVDFRLVSS